MTLSIETMRYFLLPLLGLLVGWVVAWSVSRRLPVFESGDMRTMRLPLLGLLTGFCLVMMWMVTARYVSWHSFIFDLGSYDQKVWLIAHSRDLRGMWQQTYVGGIPLSPCGVNWYWGICHFQPGLLIPALIYKVWDSPLVLLWLQVLVVASGAIPIFTLARIHTQSSAAGIAATALYFLYPAVQYNGILDFRPDHVAIPATLWAYLAAARGRYFASLALVGLGALGKETLILNAAFFGLFLAVRYKQFLLGAVAFICGIVAFYLIMFHVLRSTTISEGRFMMDRFFPMLPTFVPGAVNRSFEPLDLLRALCRMGNLRYLEALFLPLGFLPLLALPELIPAVPALAISLLSLNPEYASIEAQYSASVVAPVFAALLMTLSRPRQVAGLGVHPVPVLSSLIALSLFVTVGLGPTPISLNFWNPLWGGRWYAAQYFSDRQNALDAAAKLIPTDPNVIVVTQNDVNTGRLAHRYEFFAFPNALDRADFVLLDTGREPYIYWMWRPQQYRRQVAELKADPAYHVIYNEQGAILFERRRVSHMSTTLPSAASLNSAPVDVVRPIKP